MQINKRYLFKSFSWRLIGTIDTLIFAWIITGDFGQGLDISIITTITKVIWYYFHEQVWAKSSLINSNKIDIIKTFSWRIIGTIDTSIFGWIITGNPFMGLKIGGLETVSKMLLYYLHEKMWKKINFGLK